MAGPQKIPPASFSFLVSTLAAQAMASLGKIPNPATGKVEVQAELAKHFIDTLAVLETKTMGNLTSEESQVLETALHQLRLFYLELPK